MKVNCYGTFDSTGFGRIGHEFVYLLKEAGIDLRIVDPLTEWKGSSPPNPMIKDDILSIQGRHRDPDLIYNIYPPNGWHYESDVKCIGDFLFECDIMPKEWVEHLRKFDQIWVPNDFCFSTCWNSGLPPDSIKKLPYGLIDWGSTDHLIISTEPIFLLIGEWNERKNIKEAVKRIDENADQLKGKFVVKTFFRDYKLSDHQRVNEISLKRELKKLKLTHLNRFIFNIDHLNSIKVETLFNSIDCLIIPSKGEGFCRPFFEAGLKGIPSIVSDIPPMNEIRWHKPYAFPIKCSGLERSRMNPALPYSIWYNKELAHWFSIDLDSMIEQIRLVGENLDAARERGAQMKEICKSFFDPKQRTEERIKVMEELI